MNDDPNVIRLEEYDLPSAGHELEPDLESHFELVDPNAAAGSHQARSVAGDSPAAEGLSVDELESAAAAVLNDNDFFAAVRKTLRDAGYAGPTESVELIVLSLYSRHLPRQVNVALRAESAAGKSHAIQQGLRFAAPEAHYALTAMSSKALIYSKEVLSHRFLVLYEGEGIATEFAAYAVRSLLSEGRLAYEVTDVEHRTTDKIVKEGPTGLILSTTGPLDYELSTRMLSVSIDDSPEVTRAIMREQARRAAGEVREPDYGPFEALDRLLALEHKEVVVPFADPLYAACDNRAVRMRRDFDAVLLLVQTHALIHQRHRRLDDQGRVVATIDDYAAAYRLVGPIVAHTAGQTVPPQVRETVEAVQKIQYADGRIGGPVTLRELEHELQLHRTSISRRVNRAVSLGFLVEIGNPTGKGRRQIDTGEPMPEDAGVLPPPEVVE